MVATRPVVEVFRAPSPCPPGWSAVLSAAESARVAELRRQEDRDRVTAARALLRFVVADRLGCRPGEVVLTSRCAVCGGEHGKPVPVVPDGTAPVHTSVSYCGSVVLVARAEVPVGLDVERCAATDFDGFDATALSDGERRAVAALPVAERAGVRAALWCAKEAILKVNGRGLDVSPAAVHVGRNGAPGVVTVEPSLAGSRRVAVAAVPVDAGYRARVAVEGRAVPAVVMREVPLPAGTPAGDGRTARA